MSKQEKTFALITIDFMIELIMKKTTTTTACELSNQDLCDVRFCINNKFNERYRLQKFSEKFFGINFKNLFLS